MTLALALCMAEAMPLRFAEVPNRSAEGFEIPVRHTKVSFAVYLSPISLQIWCNRAHLIGEARQNDRTLTLQRQV